MTIARIVLLTGEAEGPVLSKELRQHNASLAIIQTDGAGLAKACDGPGHCRVISFCSPTIVPAAILAALPGPAYNFHPGPPERPGRFPSVFALYEGADRFGVTVHEMRPSVDSGAIVAADWFPIPPAADLETLETLALTQMVIIFRRLAPFLANNPRSLPRVLIPWGGPKTTKADCEALCRIPGDLSAAEVERRRRACGSHFRA